MDIKDTFGSLVSKAKSGTNVIAVETKKKMKENALKGELSSLENRLNYAYGELGKAYFATRGEEGMDDAVEKNAETVERLIAQVKDKKCETEQTLAEFDAEIQAIKAAAAVNAGGENACPACGVYNDVDSMFCMNCGQSLEKTSAAGGERFCPECGTPYETDAAFCMKCGHKR